MEISPETVSGDLIEIDGEDHQHISKSLRMKPGEGLVLCSGDETEYVCDIYEISKKQTVARVEKIQKNQSEMQIKTILYQGVPKGQKMETVIQKCVELGVDQIVPVITRRTVVKPADLDKKTARWNKISQEAAKQSGRGKIPLITEPVELKGIEELLKKNALNIVAYENETIGIKEIFSRFSYPERIGIVIGPEGGFDNCEIKMLESLGVIAVSLGKRILRTETAGMALLSMIVYQYEL